MCKPKDMIVAFIGAFIGLIIVEFTLGWAFLDVFKASPVYAGAGLGGILGFAIGTALVFGYFFTYMADAMKVKRRWISGFKLGVFFGLIAMLPWTIMAYFLTTFDFTYIIITTIYGLVEFGVAGLFAMFLLAKFGTKKK